MDTEKLSVLIQIADSGSVQSAARHLGVTRSSVRRSLAGLEAEVGAPLVHRDAAGIRLTAAGTVMVTQGRRVLEASRALLTEARATTSEPAGVIRIFEPVGMPPAFHVSGLLATHQALPNMRMELRQLENPLAHLHEPFELMLHDGPAPDRGTWFSRVVLRAPLRLAASPGYLERHGTPREVEALRAHKTLGWMRPGQPADEWPLLAGGTTKVSPWLTSADPTVLAGVAKQGGGILLTPRIPFFEEPDAPPLETVLGDEIGGDLVFRVSTPFPAAADPRTRETLKMIIALLESLPDV